MSVQEYVENVLQPKLQGDGGWVEYESLTDGKLTLVFRGECSKCLILERCVKWIKAEIKRDKGESVKIYAIRNSVYCSCHQELPRP